MVAPCKGVVLAPRPALLASLAITPPPGNLLSQQSPLSPPSSSPFPGARPAAGCGRLHPAAPHHPQRLPHLPLLPPRVLVRVDGAGARPVPERLRSRRHCPCTPVCHLLPAVLVSNLRASVPHPPALATQVVPHPADCRKAADHWRRRCRLAPQHTGRRRHRLRCTALQGVPHVPSRITARTPAG